MVAHQEPCGNGIRSRAPVAPQRLLPQENWTCVVVSPRGRVYLSPVTPGRTSSREKTRVEKPVYGVESQQGALLALPALLWLLPQFIGEGGPLRIVLAAAFGIFVAWGGVTSAIGSTAWYRLGLDSMLIALSCVGRTSRALNAVCGTGSLAVSLARTITAGEVVATDRWKPTKRVPDPSQRTRDNVRIEGVDHVVRVQEADPLVLPFKAGYFNGVGSRYGISGARKDRQKVLLEMLRVIRPDGFLVLAESLPVALWLRYRALPPLAAQYKVNDVRLSRFRFTLIISARKLN